MAGEPLIIKAEKVVLGGERKVSCISAKVALMQVETKAVEEERKR